MHSYEPYTGNLKLGETVVNPTAAATAAQAFLTACGYDVTGYTCIVSNAYSKNYTIEYRHPTNSDDRLVFHLQADAAGQVYIKDFIAHYYREK